MCEPFWAAVRPLVGGYVRLAVAATAAWTRAVCRPPFCLPAGLADVQLPQTASWIPQGRFDLEE